jgi:hypothetical protein
MKFNGDEHTLPIRLLWTFDGMENVVMCEKLFLGVGD